MKIMRVEAQEKTMKRREECGSKKSFWCRWSFTLRTRSTRGWLTEMCSTACSRHSASMQSRSTRPSTSTSSLRSTPSSVSMRCQGNRLYKYGSRLSTRLATEESRKLATWAYWTSFREAHWPKSPPSCLACLLNESSRCSWNKTASTNKLRSFSANDSRSACWKTLSPSQSLTRRSCRTRLTRRWLSCKRRRTSGWRRVFWKIAWSSNRLLLRDDEFS